MYLCTIAAEVMSDEIIKFSDLWKVKISLEFFITLSQVILSSALKDVKWDSLFSLILEAVFGSKVVLDPIPRHFPEALHAFRSASIPT